MTVRLKEFRPTILFLAKFVSIYFIGNLLYGIFISRYYPSADPVTELVTVHSGAILKVVGYDAVVQRSEGEAMVDILNGSVPVISVYEGCNGLNVMIIFVAFVFAMGPVGKRMAWFLPAGIAIIYCANLLRILFLYAIRLNKPDYVYFVHKYFFTASIYIIVFALWVWWVRQHRKLT